MAEICRIHSSSRLQELSRTCSGDNPKSCLKDCDQTITVTDLELVPHEAQTVKYIMEPLAWTLYAPVSQTRTKYLPDILRNLNEHIVIGIHPLRSRSDAFVDTKSLNSFSVQGKEIDSSTKNYLPHTS